MFTNRSYNVKKLAEILGKDVNEVATAMDSAAVGGYANIFPPTNIKEYNTKNGGIFKTCTCRVGISKKKDDGSFESIFDNNYVHLSGRAADKIINYDFAGAKTVRVQMTDCGVTRYWDKEKQKEYINYDIKDFVFPATNGSPARGNAQAAPARKPAQPTAVAVDDGDDELPF